eukprot:s839_g8.t1
MKLSSFDEKVLSNLEQRLREVSSSTTGPSSLCGSYPTSLERGPQDGDYRGLNRVALITPRCPEVAPRAPACGGSQKQGSLARRGCHRGSNSGQLQKVVQSQPRSPVVLGGGQGSTPDLRFGQRSARRAALRKEAHSPERPKDPELSQESPRPVTSPRPRARSSSRASVVSKGTGKRPEKKDPEDSEAAAIPLRKPAPVPVAGSDVKRSGSSSRLLAPKAAATSQDADLAAPPTQEQALRCPDRRACAGTRRDAEQPPACTVHGFHAGGALRALGSDPIYLNYSDIPAFPVSTVEGHVGRFVHGYLHGVPVLMMQGRVHLYEGYTAHESAFPVRVMNSWGIRTLLLTNAAGGINKNFPTGDLMLIADHINLLFQNPCVGRNDPKLPRFFPMNDAYSPRLRKIVQEIDPEVRSGVYAAMLGPNYETPAEIRMLRLNECIAARHLGLEVLGFSVITNATVDDDLSEEKVEHSEVVQEIRKLAPARGNEDEARKAVRGSSPPPPFAGEDFKPRDWVSALRGSGDAPVPPSLGPGRAITPTAVGRKRGYSNRAWSPVGASPPRWQPLAAALEEERKTSPRRRAVVPPPPATLVGGGSPTHLEAPWPERRSRCCRRLPRGSVMATVRAFRLTIRASRINKVAVVDSVMRFDFSSGNTNTEHADQVISFIEQSGFELEWILETHAHADHLSAAPYIQSKLGGKIAIGENIKLVQEVFSGVFNLGPNFRKDGSQFDHLFADGETFKLGELPASVMYTPGHTPACVCYLIGDALFTGDTLFMPDYGTARCDFPGGSSKTLYASIQRILQLPDATRVFVGHDYLPKGGRSHFAWETTIGDEKNSNIHIGGGTSEEDFVNMRDSRDAQLAVPKLIDRRNNFSVKMGMKYVGAYLMAALAGNESPSADDIKKILETVVERESVESEYDEEIASKLVSQMEGKAIHEVVAAGKDCYKNGIKFVEKLKGFGGGGGGAVAVGGGGGGGGGAAEAKKEEKKVVEEEEEEEEMDFDLFG